MRKRVISFLLCVIMLLALLPANSLPAKAIFPSETDVLYPVDGGNLLFDKETGTITHYNGNPVSVVIPEEIEGVRVVALGEVAFDFCSSLVSVTIPSSVTKIAGFQFCTNLKCVSIPDSVTTIGNGTFTECTALEELVLPNSLTSIGMSAFAECSALEEIVLPHSLTSIGGYAFRGCTKLKYLEIPAGVDFIGDSLVSGCSSLEEIEVDEANEHFCNDINGALLNEKKTELIAFPGAKGGIYEIPETVTVIRPYAFHSCVNLKGVTIPDTVTEIGDAAFSNCDGLTNIRIPDAVTELGESVFQDCNGLETVEIGKGLTELGYTVFANCTALKHVELGENIAHLGSLTFDACSSLTSIVIHKNLKTATSGLMITFRGCEALQHVLYCGTEAEFYEITTGWPVQPMVQELVNAEIRHYNARGDEVYWKKNTGGSYLYCKLCERALTPIPEGDCLHTDTQIRNRKEATCEEIGYSGDLYCIDCNEMVQPGSTVEATGHQMTDGLCTVCGKEEFKNPFDDVIESSYYYEPVLWALENNITNGVSETAFAPDKGCTRGQIATFLWRAAGCPEPTNTETPFTDISHEAYYYKAVLWAAEKGITNGVSATSFAPETVCTRGQVVTFLYRAMDKPEVENKENLFIDVSEGSYYYDAVLWAAENEITLGTGNGRFSPNDSCTRGQIVTFLYRTFGK